MRQTTHPTTNSEGNEHRFVIVTSSRNNKTLQKLSVVLNPKNAVAVVSAYDENINISKEKKAGRVLYNKKDELSKTILASKTRAIDNSNNSINDNAEDLKSNVNNHEDKNLLMTHSAKIGNLDAIIESGSLIAPSMAITNKNQNTLNDFGFGDIIFVRNPETINYNTDNIYDRDIYSPRMILRKIKNF